MRFPFKSSLPLTAFVIALGLLVQMQQAAAAGLCLTLF